MLNQPTALTGPIVSPTPVGGTPTRILRGTVVAVNPDNTVDIRPDMGRATKQGVPVIAHYHPVAGDVVIYTDLNGDPNLPAVIEVLVTTTSDPLLTGAAAGGMLTGTYPNPTIAPGTWVAPTLNAGWAIVNANYPVQYRKDGLGLVWLRGLAAATSARAQYDTIFTLPAGFTPGSGAPVEAVFGCGASVAALGGDGFGIGGSVSDSGAVLCRRPMATNDWIALDSIHFLAGT